MAEIITVEEFKAAEGINSPNSDTYITLIVNGVNTYISELLDLDNTTDQIDKVNTTHTFFLDTLAPANLIEVLDEDSNVLSGLSGSKGRYTLTNEYIGTVTFNYPAIILPVAGKYPSSIVLAALTLARYYKREEYKASASGAGQSISFVTLANHIPKHVLSLLAPYRPI